MTLAGIYFIIAFFGDTAGVVGPLPGDINVCNELVTAADTKLDVARYRGVKLPMRLPDGTEVMMGANDITHSCIDQDTRPTFTGRFKGSEANADVFDSKGNPVINREKKGDKLK